MTLHGIEAVFFDLDETLIEQGCTFDALLVDTARGFAGRLGSVAPEAFAAAFWPHAIDMWHMMIEGALPGNVARRYSFRNTLRELGLDLGLDAPLCAAADQHIVGASTLFDDALPVLSGLRDAGLAVGIVTNGYAEIQHGKIARHGLDAYADFVLVSEEAGSHKPDTGIFHQAIARAGARPGNAVFVGDLLGTDILGALNAGLHAVLFDPHGRAEKQRREHPGLPDPTCTIETHPQLLPLLGLSA